MICLIQFLACLGLTIVGFAVLLGLLKPREALQRIGAFLAVLLLGPAVIAALVKEVAVPAAIVIWSAIKHLLVITALVLALLLIVWLIAGAFELYHNKKSGEHQVQSGEE